MPRSNRLFELIQILRAAKTPITADALAAQLEVSTRTIYRDIAALQAMRTPIEGESGVGYVMRRGYDLPPLNFDSEEAEALSVGLAMLVRTGDSALQRAAVRVREKVDALRDSRDWLQVSPWGAPIDDPEKGCIPISRYRDAIREARKLRLDYRDNHDNRTDRVVRPVALTYHVECVMLAAWCETRGAFRHFRTDRVYGCDVLDEDFLDDCCTLRRLWMEQNTQNDTPGEITNLN
ncbi:MAG: YafY family protein [Pseudomonadota bacterium]